MNPSTIQIIGTVLFVCALIHTFSVNAIDRFAKKFSTGSMKENLFHFLGEIEVVFGLWSAIFILCYSLLEGFVHYDKEHRIVGGAVHYLNGLDYTEPAFVFVIMCISGTKPIILLAEKMIFSISRLIPLPSKIAFYMSTLTIGPLLGSFITEPAAMTVSALILLNNFYKSKMSQKFKYTTLGLLFVNISIGGTLTHFAAPPVLMVATKWNWDILYMVTHFGYKAVIVIFLSTIVSAYLFRHELAGSLNIKKEDKGTLKPTWWVTSIHIIFLILVICTAHFMVFFMGLFLFFLGFSIISQEYQDRVKLKESLLVGFFLAGLITLGSTQGWWITTLVTGLDELSLYFGATTLTAITDNAALTYLGSLVEDLSESKKYFLVAGAVTGGGLTVIANAPNPAGFGILKETFGESGIGPLKLLKAAILPTLFSSFCFYFLPSL